MANQLPTHGEANDLYSIMLKGHLEDRDKKFAPGIEAYLEPAILLASECQLNVTRFCCDPFC